MTLLAGLAAVPAFAAVGDTSSSSLQSSALLNCGKDFVHVSGTTRFEGSYTNGMIYGLPEYTKVSKCTGLVNGLCQKIQKEPVFFIYNNNSRKDIFDNENAKDIKQLLQSGRLNVNFEACIGATRNISILNALNKVELEFPDAMIIDKDAPGALVTNYFSIAGIGTVWGG